MMQTALLILALCVSAADKPKAAAAPKPAAKADAGSLTPEQMKLVNHVLSAETASLDPSVVPPFMDIDPDKAAPSMRGKIKAKRAEFFALKKLNDGKRKAPIRRAGQDEQTTCEQETGDEAMVKMLPTIGFTQINEDEEQILLQRTKCTECELQEEFTLKIVIVPPQVKGKPAVKYLFLNVSDPLNAIVAQYRQGGKSGTDFFSGFAGACR